MFINGCKSTSFSAPCRNTCEDVDDEDDEVLDGLAFRDDDLKVCVRWTLTDADAADEVGATISLLQWSNKKIESTIKICDANILQPLKLILIFAKFDYLYKNI